MAKKTLKNRPLDAHPKYKTLQLALAADWVLAAEVLFGITTLSSQQKKLLREAQRDACRVSVSSGHGTGKSYLQGLIIILFMIFHPNSQCVVLSNTVKQTRRGVWKNLGIHYGKLRKHAPWIARHFTLTDTMFYAKSNKQGWNCEAKAIQQGNYENLAGEHNEHFLCIVDEASGVPDDAFGVLLGALSQDDNRMILISQPTRHSGFFYRTHHELKIKPGNKQGTWVAITMSSVDSPHVTAKFIKERAIEYGGVNSVHFGIKVLGRFPDKISGFLLGRNEVEGCVGHEIEFDDREWGWMACCDVGDGRDRSVITIFKVQGSVGRERKIQQVRTIEMPSDVIGHVFVNKIIEECIDSKKYPNITVVIDGHGNGKTLANLLQEKRPNAEVKALKWGGRPFLKYEKEMYYNLRAKAHMLTRDAIRAGRLAITRGQHTEKTIEQGSKLPYNMNDMGQYLMMKKEVMRSKENIPSPDIFDTYCFAQLMDYRPANDGMYDYDDAQDVFDDWDDWDDTAA